MFTTISLQTFLNGIRILPDAGRLAMPLLCGSGVTASVPVTDDLAPHFLTTLRHIRASTERWPVETRQAVDGQWEGYRPSPDRFLGTAIFETASRRVTLQDSKNCGAIQAGYRSAYSDSSLYLEAAEGGVHDPVYEIVFREIALLSLKVLLGVSMETRLDEVARRVCRLLEFTKEPEIENPFAYPEVDFFTGDLSGAGHGRETTVSFGLDRASLGKGAIREVLIVTVCPEASSAPLRGREQSLWNLAAAWKPVSPEALANYDRLVRRLYGGTGMRRPAAS